MKIAHHQANTQEHGQAMILLAFAMIGLLAFTALAIEGGMWSLQKRIAQNGADAGSMGIEVVVHKEFPAFFNSSPDKVELIY